MVKQAGVVAWLGGIAALIGLVTWSGLGAVGQAVSSVGWGILLVVLARAVALAVAGVGWWLLFPSNMRPQLRTCVLLRFVREATNVLLPLSNWTAIGSVMETVPGQYQFTDSQATNFPLRFYRVRSP